MNIKFWRLLSSLVNESRKKTFYCWSIHCTYYTHRVLLCWKPTCILRILANSIFKPFHKIIVIMHLTNFLSRIFLHFDKERLTLYITIVLHILYICIIIYSGFEHKFWQLTLGSYLNLQFSWNTFPKKNKGKEKKWKHNIINVLC